MRIEFQQVTHSFGSTNALESISCRLASGRTTLLVGHNGSGKSTFLKLMNGILKPSSGRIWLGEVMTSEYRLSQIASMCALSFQNPDDQIFASNVEKEIRFGISNTGRDGSLFLPLVETLHLKDALSQNPFEMNYAMRRLVSIAGTAAMNTPIIAFDEPTAGLSMREKNYFGQLVSLLKELGKTIVIVTHDLDFMLQWADDLLMLSRGQIQYCGSRDAFFGSARARPVIRNCGLRIPNYLRLSRALGTAQPCFSASELVDGLIGKKGEPAPP